MATADSVKTKIQELINTVNDITGESATDLTSAVGAIDTATQATPTITVSTAGKITASATQTAGYVSAGTKSATRQLTVQAAKTVTPTTSNQTAVASGRYTTGAITVKGDANLVAGNIKSGVSIFGVAGTYTGSGGSSGGSVATCTVVFTTRNHQNRIRIGYTSYSGGSMQALYYTQNTGTSDVTLSNVPCGSAICLWADPMNAVSGGATTKYTDGYFRVIQAPSASGTYTYSIEDDS